MQKYGLHKVLILLTGVWLVVGSGLALAAESQIANTRGKINTIAGDKVYIEAAVAAGNKLGKDVALAMTPATYYLDNKTEQRTTQELVQPGSLVTAFYDSKLTAGTPPEGTAILLALGAGDQSLDYIRISRIERLGDSIKAFYDNKSINISEKVMPGCQALRPGDELAGWFSLMNAVTANEFNASKVLLLNRTLSVEEKSAWLRQNIFYGDKLLLSGVRVFKLQGVNYLPLRTVVEALGYKLLWRDDIKSITVQNNEQMATLRIGSQEYLDGSVRILLAQAPQIQEGVTVVPLDFFTDVLNKEITIKN